MLLKFWNFIAFELQIILAKPDLTQQIQSSPSLTKKTSRTLRTVLLNLLRAKKYNCSGLLSRMLKALRSDEWWFFFGWKKKPFLLHPPSFSSSLPCQNGLGNMVEWKKALEYFFPEKTCLCYGSLEYSISFNFNNNNNNLT